MCVVRACEEWLLFAHFASRNKMHQRAVLVPLSFQKYGTTQSIPRNVPYNIPSHRISGSGVCEASSRSPARKQPTSFGAEQPWRRHSLVPADNQAHFPASVEVRLTAAGFLTTREALEPTIRAAAVESE